MHNLEQAVMCVNTEHAISSSYIETGEFSIFFSFSHKSLIISLEKYQETNYYNCFYYPSSKQKRNIF